jgi:hypothetical protein
VEDTQVVRAFEDFRVRYGSELVTLFKRTSAATWKISEDQWAVAIYRATISGAPRADTAEQGSNIRAYLSSLHAQDFAFALAIRLGCRDAIQHLTTNYRALLGTLVHSVVLPPPVSVISITALAQIETLTKGVFDDLYGHQDADGLRRSLFEEFDGRISLLSWLREVIVQREKDGPSASAAFRLKPSSVDMDMEGEFLNELDFAPRSLPSRRSGSRLRLLPLAAFLAVFTFIMAARKQSAKFISPSLWAIMDNHRDSGVSQQTSREASLQFDQSTHDRLTDATISKHMPASAPSELNATAPRPSLRMDHTIASTKLRSAVHAAYPSVRLNKSIYPSNGAPLKRSTLILKQVAPTRRKIHRATTGRYKRILRTDGGHNSAPLLRAAIAKKPTDGAVRSARLSTNPYFGAKIDALPSINPGSRGEALTIGQTKAGSFGEPAAVGDDVARKPTVVAAPGHLTRWMLSSHGVIARSNDGISWQPLHSGSDFDLTAGTAPSAEVCWIVGRAGTILRTTDGEQWEKVPSPTRADLISIAARDEQSATVLDADGERFATDNGGKTWRLRRN